jgi:hypothetical protein
VLLKKVFFSGSAFDVYGSSVLVMRRICGGSIVTPTLLSVGVCQHSEQCYGRESGEDGLKVSAHICSSTRHALRYYVVSKSFNPA